MIEKKSVNLSSGDRADIDLICLMAACNDLQFATKCLLGLTERTPNDKYEEVILTAERVYCFRLVCGHLNEGLDAFLSFSKHPKTKSIIEKMTTDEKQCFDTLIEATTKPTPKESFFIKTLTKVRSLAVFHYLPDLFQKSLKEMVEKNKDSGKMPVILVGERYSQVRYLIADDVVANILGLNVGDDVASLVDFVTTIGKLQCALTRLIDIYLAKSLIVKEL